MGKAKIVAHNLDVSSKNTGHHVVPVAGGGKANDIAINGSWNHISLGSKAYSTIDARADIDLSNNLIIDADETAVAVAIAGAIPISDGSAAVGLSGVTIFTDRVANSVITSAETGVQGTHDWVVTGKVSLTAKSSGPTIQAAIAAAVVTKPSPASAASGSPTAAGAASGSGGIAGVAAQASQSKGGFGISGSATSFRDRVDVSAKVEDLKKLKADNGVSLSALDEGVHIQVAGAGAVSLQDQGVGIAGAITVVDAVKTIAAEYLAGDGPSELNTNKLEILAKDRSTYVSLAAGLAASPTGKLAVSGSIAVAVSNTTVRAGVRGSSSSNRVSFSNTGMQLSVVSLNDASYVQIAGSIAYGGKMGVGAGLGVANITTKVQTQIKHVTSSAVQLGIITLSATNNLATNTVAAGVAASKGAAPAGAGVGMVAINVVSAATVVEFDDATLSSSGDVAVLAKDSLYVATGAGGLALTKGAAGVGVAIAVNVVQNADVDGTETGTLVKMVGSSLTSTGSNQLSLGANSDATLVAAAVGAAVGKTAGIAGSAAANRYRLKTNVDVDLSSELTGDNLTVIADQQSNHTAFAGALAGAFGGSDTGALGASIALNLIDGETRVDYDGAISSAGSAIVQARSQQTLVTVGVGGAGSGNFALGGSIAVTELNGATTVNADPDVTAGSSNKAWNVNNLTVSAQEGSSVVSFAGTIGVASNVGIGAALGFVTSNRNVSTSISGDLTITTTGHTAITAGSQLPAGATANSEVTTAFNNLPDEAFADSDPATDDSGLSRTSTANSQIVNIGVAASGSRSNAFGFNLGKTSIDRDITASVGSGVIVNANTSSTADIDAETARDSGFEVSANDKTSIVSVAVGAGIVPGAGSPTTLAIAGSVALNDIDTKVEAKVLSGATINLTNHADLLVGTTNEAKIISIALGAAVSVGGAESRGSGGVGFSAAVSTIETETASVLNGTVTGTSNNAVFVTADNESVIVNVSIAAAVATQAGAAVSVAGGGAGSGAFIKGATYALVENASVTTGNMMVSAENDAEIRSVVLAVAVSIAAGQQGAAVSIGVGIANNETNGITGLPTAFSGHDGFLTAALIKDSIVDLSGALSVLAKSTQLVRADVVSAAVGVAATGGFSLSLSGAGASAENRGNASVYAAIVGSSGTHKATSQGLSVRAVNLMDLYAGVGSAAVAVALFGATNVAASISVALARNTMGAKTEAKIDGFSTSGNLSAGTGQLTVEATTKDGSEQLNIRAISVAASVAIAGGPGTAFAISGAGADSRNIITGHTRATISNVNGMIAGSAEIKAQNEALISTNVAAVALSVAVAGGSGAGALAIGGVLVSNEIGTSSDKFDVLASMVDVSATVTGQLTVQAIDNSTIDAGAGAGAGAAAGSSDLAGAAAGAGAGVYNKIYTDTSAKIERTSAVTSRSGNYITAGSVRVNSDSDSSITALSVGAALAASVAQGGLSIAIGVAIARNDIYNSSGAYIKDSALGSSTLIAAGDLSGTTAAGDIEVDADNDSVIDAEATAASVAIAGGLVGIALSGAGADSVNAVGNHTTAQIENARLQTYGTVATNSNGDKQSGHIYVDADSTVDSTSHVTSAAVSMSGGVGALSGSIGVSLSESKVGAGNLGDRAHTTVATVVGSHLDALGDVRVQATADEDHHVQVAAASVAVAIGIGVGLAGAGLDAVIENHSTVEAIVNNSSIYADGDLTVRTDSRTTVDDSIGGGSTGNTMVGTATSVGLGAIAISASLLEADVQNASRAHITASEAEVIEALRNLDVDADADVDLTDLNGVGVTLGVGVVAATGGGLNITLTVANDVTAKIDMASRTDRVYAGGNLTVDAYESVTMTSDIANTSLAAAPIGLAIGAAVMVSRHSSAVTATVADVAASAGDDILIVAKSDLNIDRADSTGVTMGTVATTVNTSTAQANATVQAVIQNAQVAATDQLDVLSTYDATVRASTLGVSAGLGAIGAMIATIEAGKGTSNDSQVTIENKSDLRGVGITLQSEIIADLFAKTTAGGGGGVAAIGAVSNLDDSTTAATRVEDGTAITAQYANVQSTTARKVDGNADAHSVALASGAGAKLNISALGDAKVEFYDGDASGETQTVITAQRTQIDTFNQTYKEFIVQGATGVSASNTNNVASGSGNGVGIAAIGSDSDIGTSSDKTSSTVHLGNTKIVGVGSYKTPSSVIIRALTDISAADAVEVTAVSGAAGLAVALADTEIRQDTRVDLTGTTIDNVLGDVKIESRASIRNTNDAAAFQTGFFTANFGVDSRANTYSETDVDISGAKIKGKRIEVNAGKANSIVNSLVSRTEANGSLLSAGVSVGVATQNNSSQRNSAVTINNSELLSAGNLVVAAENGFKQTSSDGMVVAVAVPPYGYSVGDSGSHSQSRDVVIDSASELRAGVNFKTVYQIRYAADFPSSADGSQFSPLSTGQSRDMTTAEKALYGLNASQKYTVEYWDSSNLAVDVFRGDIVELEAANSSTATGTVGDYYEYIGAPSGTPVSLTLTKTNYTDATQWRHLGSSLTDQQEPYKFGSNGTSFIKTALSNQIVVIRPSDVATPTISVGQLSTLLASQYQQVKQWIASHSSNAEAVLRYQAQLDQIVYQMNSLGLSPPDSSGGTTVLSETFETLFVELPELVASPGSIYISSGRSSSSYTGLVTSDVLKAHRDVTIDIDSDLYMMMRMNDVVIESTKVARISESTGDYQEFFPGNVYVNDVLTGTTSSSDPTASIDILIDARSRSHYTYIDDIEAGIRAIDPDNSLAQTAPDLYVLGSLVNDLGEVKLSNLDGAIRVSGQILAEKVTIQSGGDFTVTTDWYHTGQNPRTYDGISSVVDSVEPDHSGGQSDPGTTVNQTYVGTSNLSALLADQSNKADQSAVIANGLVSIVATYVNVNGLIQSGVQSASITIEDTFVAPSRTTQLMTGAQTALPGITLGTVNGAALPVQGRWDAAQRAIVLEEMRFEGGRVEITGRVFSTGEGEIKVASGYADVSIVNSSDYDLIVEGIDADRDRQGVIQITDTLKSGPGGIATRTVYTKTAGGMQIEILDAELNVPGNASGGIKFVSRSTSTTAATSDSYSPVSGTMYTWTEGLSSIRQTVDTRYTKSFNVFFDFPAGSGTQFSENIENLSDAPLLESEGVIFLKDVAQTPSDLSQSSEDLGGWSSLPDNTDMYVRFKHISDPTVELTSSDIVKGPDGRYWEFVGSGLAGTLKIELSTLFSGNDLVSTYSGEFTAAASGTSFSESDRDKGEYLHSFKNYEQDYRQWTTGGGYMKPKTVWRETTTIEGLKKYWDIAIRGDKSIDIGFITGAANPTIAICSVGDLVVAGDIATADTGNIRLNDPTFSELGGMTGGAVTLADRVSLRGVLDSIESDGDVNLILVNNANNVANQELNIQAGGNVNVSVGSETNSDGSIVIGTITAGGNVVVSAAQGISAASGSSLISGERVELQSSQGMIGSASQAIRINTDHTVADGGFAGAASTGLYVTETSGNLHLVAPETISTEFVRPDQGQTISVGSTSGTVKLQASDGSVYDYNLETDGTLTNARLAAYKEKVSGGAGTRAIVGAKLDGDVRGDYALYLEYWEVMQTPNSDGSAVTVGQGLQDAVLENNTGYQNYIDARVASGTARATAEAEGAARFGAIHAAEYDKSIRTTATYQEYYRVIQTSQYVADDSLTNVNTFDLEVDSQLQDEMELQIEQRFGAIHNNLATYDLSSAATTDEDTLAVRAYIADKSALQSSDADAYTFADGLLGSFDYADVQTYKSDVRANHLAAHATIDETRPYAMVLNGASIADQAVIDRFDAALGSSAASTEKAAIESELTFKFAELHALNKDKATQKDTYVDSLFLEGDARTAAIDAELANYGSLDGVLSTSVAAKLFPLLDISSVSGGAGPAAENANIVAENVEITASGSDSSDGQIGILKQPTDVDFPAALNNDDDQALLRALQSQDIIDIVYKLYRYDASSTVLVPDYDSDSLPTDPDFTELTVVGIDALSNSSQSFATGQVYAIWGDWTGGSGEPEFTYKLFQRTGSTTTSTAASYDWYAGAPSGFTELLNNKGFDNDQASISLTNGDIFFDVRNVLRVSVRPFDDINLRAVTETTATNLTMSSSSNAGIGHDGQTLNILSAQSAGFLRLVTTGSIYDASSSGYAASANNYVSLIADGQIGTDTGFFRVSLGAGTELLLQSGTSAFIEQVASNDLTLASALTGTNLVVKTPGSLQVGEIRAIGSATLEVGGDVTDLAADDSDASVDVRANELVLDVTGNVGSAQNRIEVLLSRGVVGSVGGDITLHEFDIFHLGQDLSIGGDIDLLARNSIISDAGINLAAQNISFESQNAFIGSVSNAMNIQLGTGGLFTANAVTAVYFTSDRDVNVNEISAQNLVNALITGGALLNGRADTALNVSVNGAFVVSASSIGSSAKALRQNVDTMMFKTTDAAGIANIDEADSVRFVDVNAGAPGFDGHAGKAASNVNIKANNNIIVDQSFAITNGSLQIDADSLDVNFAVETQAGNIDFDITNAAVIDASVVTQSGDVTFDAASIDINAAVASHLGSLALTSSGATTIDGTVDANKSGTTSSAAGDITVTANSLDVNSAVETQSGDIDFDITNAAVIDASVVTQSGDVTFDAASIDINAAVASHLGSLALTSSGATTIDGTVDANKSGTTSSAAGDITVTANSLDVNSAVETQAGDIDFDITTDAVIDASVVTQSGDITVDSQDSVTISAPGALRASGTVTIDVDSGAWAADAAGGVLNVSGSLEAALVNINSYDGDDTLTLAPVNIDGDVAVKLGDGRDTFTLSALNNRESYETFHVDGEQKADEFILNRGMNAVSYNITFSDSGTREDGADFLTINLRDADDASGEDLVLIRKNFIALLNGTMLAPSSDFERINYDESINGRVRVNGLGGNDSMYSDDNSAMVTLDGGDGDDNFQVGQLFGADRVAPNVASGDEIETNETTQGFLSVGNSVPMVIYGGDGEDNFAVYSNKALTKLYGEAGNDYFIVRAFVLKANPSATAGGGDTELFGGGGDDQVAYNINAPLKIDGGDGVDTVVVLGTEADDSFMIDDEGIYGAGLNIGFAGIEIAEVDGLGGDDSFFVLSTSAKISLTVIGGLGSDTISVAGDVTEDIVSLEVEGVSAFVNHAVASSDAAFNQIFVDGVRLNIAASNRGLVEIDRSGLAVLDEGGAAGYYDVRLTSAVTQTAYLTVSAARSSSFDRNLSLTSGGSVLANSLNVAGGSIYGSTPVQDYASANVLSFTSSNWNDWQRVYVEAPEDDAMEGTRIVTISHALQSDDPAVQGMAIQNVEIDVLDNDAAVLHIGGNPSEIDILESADYPASGTVLELSLSRRPDAGETITVSPSDPRDGDFEIYKWDQTSSAYLLLTSDLTFDDTNWNTATQIKVVAVDDAVAENREQEPLKFTVSTDKSGSVWESARVEEIDVNIFDNDKGEVLVTETGDGTLVTETQSDRYSLVLSKQPTADVVVSILTDGQTVAGSSDARWNDTDKTITFTAANWDQSAEIELTFSAITQTGQPTIAPTVQPQTLTEIRGPIYAYGSIGPGADRSLQPGYMLPTETDTALPIIEDPTNEDEETDRLFVYNAGSVVGQSGTMSRVTSSDVFGVAANLHNISGLDMGSVDLELEIETGVYQKYKAGINYDEFEIIELMMGQADDTLNITSTAEGAVTVVHGGGGSDNISVLAGSTAGGASRSLVLYGDTDQSGTRYSQLTDDLTGQARAFPATAHGNDIIDASGASGFVVAYGGAGDDQITGSNYDDNLLGGSGGDTIQGLLGDDHLYGDNAVRVDLSMRWDLLVASQAEILSVVTSQDSSAADFFAQTGDALASSADDRIEDTGGDNIIVSDFGLIDQVAGTVRAYDTGAVTQVSSIRDDEGGGDTIITTASTSGRNWVLAGVGDDTIDLGDGGGVVIADHGQFTIHNAQHPLVAQSATVDKSLGGKDTITARDGSLWIIGGADIDNIDIDDGNHIILGDSGTITADVSQNLLDVQSSDLSVGAGETITVGDTLSGGSHFIIGGFGGDNIAAGNGDAVIIGDAGQYSESHTVGSRQITLASTDPSNGGDDTIAHGDGDLLLVAGAGGDTITSGSGSAVIIGDDGDYTKDEAANRIVVRSVSEAYGGKDIITKTNGSSIVIGGLDGDEFSNEQGVSTASTDVVIGDFGTYTTTHAGAFLSLVGQEANALSTTGGADTILTGTGTLYAIGGTGGDTITNVGGDAFVFGDGGRIEAENVAGLITLYETLQDSVGGADDIDATGVGSAHVFGGRAGDNINTGDGKDWILGDHGILKRQDSGLLISMKGVEDSTPSGGADIIDAGSGSVMAILGQDGDTLTNRGGGNLAASLGEDAYVIADHGQILTDENGLVNRMESLQRFDGGDDTITHSVSGRSFMLGGASDDTITTSIGNDVILGDFGYITFTGGIRQIAESDISNPTYGGDDVISTSSGQDWVIAGEGDDQTTNSAGLSIAIGDAGIIEADASGLYTLVESLQNSIGGDDELIGGSDRDVLIGGAESDILRGNDGPDLLAGDGAKLRRSILTDGVTVQNTFENIDIQIGGKDTIYSGAGRDIAMGGFSGDGFEIDFIDDVAVGEFVRVRLNTDVNGDEELVGYVSPAPVKVDLLNQELMKQNRGGSLNSDRVFSVSVSEVSSDIAADLDQSDGEDADTTAGRLDLIYLDENFAWIEDDAIEEADGTGGGDAVYGASGFSFTEQPDLLMPSGDNQLIDGGGQDEPNAESPPAEAQNQEDEPTPVDSDSVEGAFIDQQMPKGWIISEWKLKTERV